MKGFYGKFVAAGLACMLIVTSMPFQAVANEQATDQPSAMILADMQKEKKDTKKYVDGEALVVFSSQLSAEGVESTGLSGDMQMEDSWDFSSENTDMQTDATGTGESVDTEGSLVVALVKSDSMTTDQLISNLKQNPMVESAEPNYICHVDSVTNDTYSNWQWGLSNTGQNAGTVDDDINVDSVWSSSSVTGSQKIIAIVDTGTEYTNSELSTEMWVNPYQGRLSGTYGYDFANMDDDPMDDNGHGSHCAGIIAAAGNNNAGISGVNQQAKIMSLKFLDGDGSGTLSGAVSSYNYIYRAMKLGADVVAINNSWGTADSQTFEVLVNKLGEMGAVSLFAAGNEGTDDDTISDGIWSSDSPYLITVAASNENDALASFSNYGKNNVSLAAPGTDILSTVSSACFNPGIYEQSLRTTLCSNFNDYNDGGTVITGSQNMTGFGVAEDTDITSIKTAGSTVSYSAGVNSTKYFGKNGGKSYTLSVTNAKAGDVVTMALPYTLPANLVTEPTVSAMITADGPTATKTINFFDTEYKIPSYLQIYDCSEAEYAAMETAQYADSEPTGLMDISGASNYWSHLTISSGGELSKGSTQNRRFVIQIVCAYDGDYSICLDDFGVTKGLNMNESTQFGNYDYYCGTSMATPFVSGAVALVSAIHPECTADEIASMVKASVRKTTEMENKTSSGGILDLSKLEDPVPVISNAVVQSDHTVRLSGYGFRQNDTVLKINGTEVPNTVVSSKELTFDGSPYLNQILTISVTTARGTAQKNLYLVNADKTYTNLGSAEDYANFLMLMEADGLTTTDGDTMYYYDSIAQTLDTFSIQEGSGSPTANLIPATMLSSQNCFPKSEIKDGSFSVASNMVYLDGKIYMIACLEEAATTYKEYALVYYDKATMSIGTAGQLPDAYNHIEEETLAAYNGQLFLVGGYDYNVKTLSTAVTVYDPQTMKWSDGIALPSGRAAGQCIQVGNQLFYTLGETESSGGSYQCPANLIFNGTSWSICDSTAGLSPYTYENISHDGKTLALYRGNVGLAGKNVLYSGIPCKGLGDTFTYSIEDKTYQRTAYNFITSIQEQTFKGALAGQYLIGTSLSNNQINLYCAKLDFKPYAIIDSSTSHGSVEQNTDSMLPGSLVTLTAYPDAGYYVKSFLVNGALVQGNSTQFRITGDTTIKATFAAYVKKITLNKSSVQIDAGRTATLKATFSPSSAGNKAVTWKSSNTKYATVDQSGKVTAKKAGIGHTVTITATAKDGSKVKATCKVTVIRGVTKVKLTASSHHLSAGKKLKLSVIITPSNAAIKDVTFKSSNTKYATVDKNGKVSAKKAGIGHTVTITATSKDNSKIKGTYKITIEK